MFKIRPLSNRYINFTNHSPYVLLLKYFPDFLLLYILCFYWTFTQMQMYSLVFIFDITSLFLGGGVPPTPGIALICLTSRGYKYYNHIIQSHISFINLFPYYFAQNFHKSNYAILVFSGRISPNASSANCPTHFINVDTLWYVIVLWFE